MKQFKVFAGVIEANAEREPGVPGAPDFGAMGCEPAAEILTLSLPKGKDSQEAIMSQVEESTRSNHA